MDRGRGHQIERNNLVRGRKIESGYETSQAGRRVTARRKSGR